MKNRLDAAAVLNLLLGRENNQFSINISGSISYVLIDRFALGFAFGLDRSLDAEVVATAGLQASFHFWNSGQLAAFSQMGFRLGLTENTVKFPVPFALGLEYFVVPTVAIGPTLFLNHYNDGIYGSFNRYGVAFDLAVYL